MVEFGLKGDNYPKPYMLYLVVVPLLRNQPQSKFSILSMKKCPKVDESVYKELENDLKDMKERARRARQEREGRRGMKRLDWQWEVMGFGSN